MFVKGQLKSAHFWLTVLASGIALLSQSSIVPAAGLIHNLLLALAGLLGASGYQTAVRWIPPAPDMGAKKPSGLGVGLLFLGALSLPLNSCAWLKANQVAQKTLNCATQGVENALPGVLAEVLQALIGASPDWTALGNLEAKNGIDVVACAVQSIFGQALAAPTQSDKLVIMIKNNAQTYLKARGF